MRWKEGRPENEVSDLYRKPGLKASSKGDLQTMPLEMGVFIWLASSAFVERRFMRLPGRRISEPVSPEPVEGRLWKDEWLRQARTIFIRPYPVSAPVCWNSQFAVIPFSAVHGKPSSCRDADKLSSDYVV